MCRLWRCERTPLLATPSRPLAAQPPHDPHGTVARDRPSLRPLPIVRRRPAPGSHSLHTLCERVAVARAPTCTRTHTHVHERAPPKLAGSRHRLHAPPCDVERGSSRSACSYRSWRPVLRKCMRAAPHKSGAEWGRLHCTAQRGAAAARERALRPRGASPPRRYRRLRRPRRPLRPLGQRDWVAATARAALWAASLSCGDTVACGDPVACSDPMACDAPMGCGGSMH